MEYTKESLSTLSQKKPDKLTAILNSIPSKEFINGFLTLINTLLSNNNEKRKALNEVCITRLHSLKNELENSDDLTFEQKKYFFDEMKIEIDRIEKNNKESPFLSLFVGSILGASVGIGISAILNYMISNNKQ